MQVGFAVNILNSLPFGPLGFMLILPLVAALIAYFAGKGGRIVTLFVTAVELGLSILLVLGTDTGSILSTDPEAGMNFITSFIIGTIPVGSTAHPTTTFQFILGVDGLSVIMLLLSNLVVFIAAISSNHIHKSEGLYYSLFLLLQTGHPNVLHHRQMG